MLEMTKIQKDQPNQEVEESEPYLGFSWAIAMLVLYGLKQIFPAETYSKLWWFQMYILAIIFGITIFTLIKRYKHFRREEPEIDEES